MEALRALLLATSLPLAVTANAEAMTMRVSGDQAILTGPLVPGDVDDFSKLLAANPGVKTVILWNSPGGAFVANRGLSKLIKDRELDTAVGGHCVSACAMVFLSGKERSFSDAEKVYATSLGFHGSYVGGTLAPEERLTYLKGVVAEDTGGKADPGFVDLWLHQPDEASTIRFRFPNTSPESKEATVYACHGPAANLGDYSKCRPIAGRDALSMGIITSTTVIHVNP